MRLQKLGFLIILLAIVNQSQGQSFTKFKWANDSVSGRYVEKVSILIPVKIDNLPNNFLMQLDLGSNKTIIRGNTIRSFYTKFPELEKKLDTVNLFKMQTGTFPHLNDISISIGNTFDCKVNAACLEDYGIEIPVDLVSPETEILIGSIGADILKNKILILDYPNNEICITEASKVKLSAYNFFSFQFLKENEDNRILLPFSVNGQEVKVLFDTGASMFELSTIEKNAKLICDSEVSDSIVINSWGEKKIKIGLKSNVELKIGTILLSQILVYYDKSNKYDYFYESNHIFGLTGNALFLNDIIMIDYENRRFGVKINSTQQ
ncbi:hypothetical protein [Labilibaculum euxinus]